MPTASSQRVYTAHHQLSKIWHQTASDSEASVLQLWEILNRPSLLLFPDPLCPRVVIPLQVPFMDHADLFNLFLYLRPFNSMQMELFLRDNNTWNHLTTCKLVSSSLFNDFIHKLFAYFSYMWTNKIWHLITHKVLYTIKEPYTTPVKVKF